MAPPTPTPPGLQEATRKSTAHWQDDLQALFDHAKDRFADVVWELSSDSGKGVEEIWGHKGSSFVFRLSSAPRPLRPSRSVFSPSDNDRRPSARTLRSASSPPPRHAL